MDKITVLIPARGGSKGLPGKNIRPLNGKPLIAHTVEAALKSKYVDEVVITTDSEEIAEVCRQYGARVPFLRPAELALDTSPARDAYIHAIDFLSAERGKKIDKFMVLLPTAPLRDETDIDKAFEQFIEAQANTLVAVTEAPTPPNWYTYIDDTGRMKYCGFGNGIAETNRQQLGKYYILCGAIYILDYDLLVRTGTYVDDNTVAYVMPSEKAADIDTLEDFEYVEFLMNKDKK